MKVVNLRDLDPTKFKFSIEPDNGKWRGEYAIDKTEEHFTISVDDMEDIERVEWDFRAEQEVIRRLKPFVAKHKQEFE